MTDLKYMKHKELIKIYDETKLALEQAKKEKYKIECSLTFSEEDMMIFPDQYKRLNELEEEIFILEYKYQDIETIFKQRQDYKEKIKKNLKQKEKHINATINEKNKDYKPRYEKDEFYVSNTTKQYNKSVYKKFKHTWKIQNRGKNIWTNRKLVLTNNEQLKLEIVDKIININETKPYDFVTIEVEVETRGYEGGFTCEWELQDEDGYNCFENTKDFNFEIIVIM